MHLYRMNRLPSRGRGEEKVGRKRIEERGGERPHPFSPFGQFALTSFSSALLAAVRPIKPEPVHKLMHPLFQESDK